MFKTTFHSNALKNETLHIVIASANFKFGNDNMHLIKE